MARFGELLALGFPLLVGTSRKRLIGHLVGADRAGARCRNGGQQRYSSMKGARIFRVHNVGLNRDALAFADAMIERENAVKS